MGSLATLAQALGLSYAAGINLYATVAVVGLAERFGVIGPLPGALGGMSHPVVIGIAGLLYAIEFLATLVPGIASVWETAHSFIRPPAAAFLAAATAWGGDAALVTAATLLGGSLALGTHATKLGVRYAIDTSPEPVTNGAANVAELGMVAAVIAFVWEHPFLVLAGAVVMLVALALTVRMVWRALKRVFTGRGDRGEAPANGT